jgi:hypothetical protein
MPPERAGPRVERAGHTCLDNISLIDERRVDHVKIGDRHFDLAELAPDLQAKRHHTIRRSGFATMPKYSLFIAAV